jgi:pimeloyl-ACP methyl ester carboxylesterase
VNPGADAPGVFSGPGPFRPEPPGRAVPAGRHHYHVITLGGSAAGGAPAVFLHGGGPGCSAWTDFGPTAELFAANRTCHFVDLLQYGKSDKAPITGPRWSYLAASLAELLDALGVLRADVVCNSWGGTIGLALAAEHPGRVRSLVVTGSMPVFYGPLAPLPERGRRGRNARDRYFGGAGPSLEKMRELMATLEWYDDTRIPEGTVRLRHEQSLDPGEMHLAASSDDLRGDWQDLEDHLRRIRCRVLFCWGMHDGFLTPDYPLMLARMVPHGQLYVMDEASHHLQEERPWDYVAIVEGFLRQTEPDDAPTSASVASDAAEAP